MVPACDNLCCAGLPVHQPVGGWRAQRGVPGAGADRPPLLAGRALHLGHHLSGVCLLPHRHHVVSRHSVAIMQAGERTGCWVDGQAAVYWLGKGDLAQEWEVISELLADNMTISLSCWYSVVHLSPPNNSKGVCSLPLHPLLTPVLLPTPPSQPSLPATFCSPPCPLSCPFNHPAS